MALQSGSFTSNIAGTWFKIKVLWTENSTSTANNTSNVTVKVQLITSGGAISSTASKNISLTINGTKYTGTCTVGMSSTQTKTIMTKTVDITHNNDGSKSFGISCTLSLELTLSGTYYGSKIIEKSGLTLSNIARASTFSVSGTSSKPKLGEELTISVSRKETSYSHTITYKLENASGNIATKSKTDTIKWTAPYDLANQIPNATSARCTFTLETFNSSGTSVGKQSFALTLYVPDTDTFKPKVSSVTLTETVTAVKNLSIGTNKFLNVMSKVAYSISASGVYNSTIKTYSLNFADVTYSGQSGTTGSINKKAGTYKAIVTITDSRGRTGTKEISYEIFAYEMPLISNFTATRNENDETAVDIAFTASISSIAGKNTCSISLSKRITDTGDFVSFLNPVATSNTYTHSAQYTGFSSDNPYELKITLTDKFNSVSRIIELPTGTPVFDVAFDGSGMGFYQVANRNEYGFRKPVAFYGGWKAKEIEATKEKPYNIDTILQAGIYHCSDTTYLTNKPYNQTANITASLMVLECGNAGQLEQIYTVCTKDGNLEYRRFRFYNSWGEWYRTSGEVVLWQTADNSVNGDYGTGGLYMQASQTIKLSEPISKQPNGIKLVFCRYYNGQVVDQQVQTFTVSKTEVAITGKMGTYENGNPRATGAGHTFLLTSAANFTLMAAKYLYIADEYITGNDNNKTGVTVGDCGVTYTNNAYVLRLVIGY